MPSNHYQEINLYVNNLDDAIDDERLRKEFSPYGTITSAKVMVRNDKSEGYGFVCFTTPDEATQALNAMNGRTIGSQKLYVAYNRQHHTEKRNLYVKNLSGTVDDDRLRKEFSPYGKIVSAKVMMEMGKSKKFGFVCFSTPEEATKAVEEMHGRTVGSKPLYVTFAQSKEERKTQLTSQYMRRTEWRTCNACLNNTMCGLKSSSIQSAKITSTSQQQRRKNVTSTSGQGQGGLKTSRPANFRYTSNVRNAPQPQIPTQTHTQRSGFRETAAGRIQQAVITHQQRHIGATGILGASPSVCQETGCGCPWLYRKQ